MRIARDFLYISSAKCISMKFYDLAKISHTLRLAVAEIPRSGHFDKFGIFQTELFADVHTLFQEKSLEGILLYEDQCTESCRMSRWRSE